MPKNKLKDHAAAAMGRHPNHGGGRGGGGGGCRKHPKHKQSPGVCSVCLREKLCNLSITDPFTNTKTASSSTKKIIIPSISSSSLSSLSSYYSSSSPSSSSSPYFPRKKASISSILFKRRSSSSTTTATTNFLTKTKSLADADHHLRTNKSHHGFWSKLMMNRRGKEILEETLRGSTSSTTDHQPITTT